VDPRLSGVSSAERFARPPDLTLLAPAKVNLFLRVLGRREDGFHELASLFQAVSLSDTLDFWVEDPDSSEPICSMEVTADSVGRDGIPTDGTNLVMRALALFAEKTGEQRRIHCRLHKRVPAQAGLGGGSGDAATALFAANRLAGCPASTEQLTEWGGELGSDISFFFSRGTAYCTGRGEVVDPVAAVSDGASCVLVKPAEGLSTPAVFQNLGLDRGDPGPSGPEPEDLLAALKDGKPGLTDVYVNDLAAPAFRVFPKLQELADDLARVFPVVQLSGSGSTLFALGAPSEAGWQDTIRAKYDVDIFEERFCNRLSEKRWYAEED
jgi:4-diphosphocytidyl-2-C-methyl-D-erythritol kinase